MIDLHTHVLHGVDDGADSLEESLALARAASADGVRVLAATPHVRADYPTTADDLERLLAELRDAVDAAGVPIELVGGGELSLQEAGRLDDGELRRFSLGGQGTLLLEFPYAGWPLGLELQLFELQARGFRTLLAHPERNHEVQARPERLRPLVESGSLVQVTGGSLKGRMGASAQLAARRLLELGLVHVLATDAHDATGRRGRLSGAAAAVGDAGLARWLTWDTPAAILQGEPVSAAPRRQARRRTLRLPSLRRG